MIASSFGVDRRERRGKKKRPERREKGYAQFGEKLGDWERVRELRRGRWFEIERDGELNCESELCERARKAVRVSCVRVSCERVRCVRVSCERVRCVRVSCERVSSGSKKKSWR